MKVLMISTDRKLFQENSAVRQRIIEYGKLADELRIIVFSRKELQTANLERQISDNVFLYPTNSKSRWFYVYSAIKIGCRIIKRIQKTANNSGSRYLLISAQDPFECGLAGWFLKRKFNIPLQLQIHTDLFSPHFWRESILNKLRVLAARFTIPRADCIRVVSKRIKKSLIAKFRNIETSKITVLPVFIDVQNIQKTSVGADLRKKYPQFNFIILMASRLTAEKNIGLAIEAMVEITKKYPKTGSIIVGSGPEEKNLSSLVTRYGLRDNVIFEPWTDDIISYYRTANLFLLTSNYEGYGMAAIEAVVAGCPVVMTDVGLAGEVLIDKKDGIIVPIGDQKKLAEAIFNLIENHDLRQSLTANAGKIIAFWPTTDRYLKAYRDAWFLC